MFFEILCHSKPLKFEKAGARGEFLDRMSDGAHFF